MTRTPNRVRAPSRWALQVLLFGVVAALAGGGGCSDRDALPPLAGGGSAGRGSVEAGPCSEGTTQPCGIKLATHGDIVTCFQGTQTCQGGAWEQCGNGKVVERRIPSGSGASYHPQAIGDASPCVGNPCDPFCWNYPNEYPDSPFKAFPADGGSVYDWQSGSPTDLPPGLVAKGMKEPCESAADCQFNHRCDHVATDSTCAHSKCLQGAALSATCRQNDGCVDMICNQRSTCCGDSCGHDLCATGVKLDASCSTCAASICAARPSCCDAAGSWDATCVSMVNTSCAPLTCGCGAGQIENPATGHCYLLASTSGTWSNAKTACEAYGAGWSLVSIGNDAENTFVHNNRGSNPVWIGYERQSTSFGPWHWVNGDPIGYTNWDSGEPNGSDKCAAMRPTTAKWHDWGCSDPTSNPSAPLRRGFCEGPKLLSGRAWDSTCVGMVQSVCSATCGSGAGTCVPWWPGETDPNCTGVDLALGIPCTPPNNTVPVCNHGSQVVPAGVEVAVFAANSQQYPSCNPDMMQSQGTCTTTEEILPGDCISLDCPAVANGNQKALMVNPPGAAHQTECTCLDNWAVYDTSMTCGTPPCGGTAFRATFKRVSLFLVMNRGVSMAAEWTGAVQGLTSFFQDQESAGIGVGLEFFPLLPNVSAGSLTSGDGCPSGCAPDACENPMVPVAPLAFYAAPNDTQEDHLIQALSVGTGGTTPSYPALQGTLNAALAHHAANPNDVTAVVFASDSDPNDCLQTDVAQTNTGMATLAGNAAAQGVNTHTICFGTNCAALNAIAASGGTTQARTVAAGSEQTQLLAALRAIAAQSVSCTFALPSTGTFNQNNVSVTYTPIAGGAQTLPRVQLASDCGAGWYFDNNTNPTTITLCPSTCTTLRANFGADIDVELGCPVPLTGTALTEVYEGVCPEGSGPVWNFLSYDSVVPPNTSLHFAARTAGTLLDLGTAVFHPIADVPSDPAVCTIGVPGCPADLFQPLSPTDNRLKFLELAMTFVPTSNGLTAPTVNNWQILYSCQPNQ